MNLTFYGDFYSQSRLKSWIECHQKWVSAGFLFFYFSLFCFYLINLMRCGFDEHNHPEGGDFTIVG